MEIIRSDGWILDVQRLDGTKVSVHVSERKVNKWISAHIEQLLVALCTCA